MPPIVRAEQGAFMAEGGEDAHGAALSEPESSDPTSYAARKDNEAPRDSETHLRTLNWALTAFAKSSSALLHGANLDGVVKNVCEAIVEDDAYCLASVALAEPPPSKWLNFVAGAGPALGYLEGLRLSSDENQVEGSGPTGQSIRSRTPWIMGDSLVDPMFAPWREKGRAFGIRSSLTVPFSHGGRVLGVLLVYASRPNAFGPQEMGVFQRLGDELAFSIALDEERARLAASQEAQRQAEAAEAEALRKLRQSEARYRMLAENVPDILVQYDLDGVIEYVSPSIRRIGREPGDLVGRSINELIPSGAARGAALKALQAGLPLPSGRVNERMITLREGGEVWLQGNPATICDAAGKVIGVVTVMRDVTERRAMEEELRRKQAEAEQAAVVKAQFLANMSHEIRNPLTAVIGFAGLLERVEPLPDKARVYTERIKAGGAALLEVVNQVLDFSRLEAGKIELHPQPCDLSRLLDETVAMMLDEAARKGLALGCEPRGVLPALVSVDGGRLQQVLLNLLGNAIKFTSEGEVRLAVSHEPVGGGRLRVEVTDTGDGVAPDQAHLLFQRFSQIDGSNTREYGGVGLGLAISKGLVEMMGGEIGLEPAEGGGSRFWFTVRAPVVAVGEIEPVATESAPSLAALRILVVDDVAVNRELLISLLMPFDVQFTQAADGAQAVDLALREPFDLILMDLQMPVMDGLAATMAIRTGAGPNKTTPILAVSANVMPPQVAACLNAGMNDHVGKPVDPADLLNKIAVWTENRPAGASV